MAELKTDNELIAEFMDGKVSMTHISQKITMLKMARDIKECKKHGWVPDLRYDTDWNSLMPAFDKFASHDYESDDYAKHCVAISEKILECDIQGACERLAEAIKWYNDQQK